MSIFLFFQVKMQDTENEENEENEDYLLSLETVSNPDFPETWRRFRLKEWTEDVTVKWIRSISYRTLSKDIEYSLIEAVLLYGWDGAKLIKHGVLTYHPARMSNKQQSVVLKIMKELFLGSSFSLL